MRRILAGSVGSGETLSDVDPDQSFYVPPAHEAGTYAHAVAVWYTTYDFTIDFAALPEAGGEAHVVSRVRVPAALAFDLIRTINTAMGRYEATWGEIRRPGPRDGEQT